MKIMIGESFPGEFDQDPDVIEVKAVQAARNAVLDLFEKAFKSHQNMPDVGDRVENTNSGCKHYGSQGVVVAVKNLPKNAGKTIAYRCTNAGDAWEKGQLLEKTPDQLSPMKLQKGAVVKKRRGGQVDALDTIAQEMSDMYHERMDLLKKELKQAIQDRNK